MNFDSSSLIYLNFFGFLEGGVHMFFIHLKRNKGSALLTIIVVMAVLILLGFSILSTSVSEAKQAAFHANKVQANYFARTAVDDMANYLFYLDANDQAIPSSISNSSPNDIEPIKYDTNMTSGTMSITVGSRTGTVDSYTINGTGYRLNTTSDTELIMIRPAIWMVWTSAVYTFGNTNLNTWRICGDVSSIGTVNIQDNNTFIDACGGKLVDEMSNFDFSFYSVIDEYFIIMPDDYLDEDAFRNGLRDDAPEEMELLGLYHLEEITNPEEEGVPIYDIDFVPVDSDPVIIDKNYVFNSITIENGQTINIHNNDSYLSIIVDDLSIKQGTLSFNGSGTTRVYIMKSMEVETNSNIFVGSTNTKVEIYAVTNQSIHTDYESSETHRVAMKKLYTPADNTIIDIKTPIKVNTGENIDSDQVKFLLDKNSTLEIQANAEFRAFIIGPGSTVDVQGVGGSDNGVYGSIIAKTLLGNSGRVFLNLLKKVTGMLNFL